jgi:hypothetical protein
MKWVLIGLSAAVLALAVGTFALTAQGDRRDPRPAVATANAAPVGAATPAVSAKPDKGLQSTRNRQCEDGESDNGDSTGDDNGNRTGGACRSNDASDNSGDDQAGDAPDSSDNQAGDAPDSSDDQAGDGRSGGD